MDWKKLGKTLLFPRPAVRIALSPVSAVLLTLTLIFCDTESVPAILSYVLAAYTLTVWCVQIPRIVRWFQRTGRDNPYLKRWREDARLRVRVSLYGTVIWNAAYAALQLGMGIWHRTFWFYSLAGYYLLLAVIRFFLLRHTGKHLPGERMLAELQKYRVCGIVFLLMNLALTLMIFFMVYWNRTFHHHEITTIAMAAYTFTSLTLAIINTVKYRKYRSPVYSATKAISLASACVSMLTLEATMLTTFGEGKMEPLTRKLMLGISGGVISAFIIAMAIYMIVRSTKQIKLWKKAKEKPDGTKG
ncbi:MAG: hypothetical protein IJY82_02215 [Oscillospiraceae bacterium]|nr:hypothetical protein [Oscillospiraceae bacterium]